MTRNTVILLLIGLLIVGGGAYVALAGKDEGTGYEPPSTQVPADSGESADTGSDWPAQRPGPVPTAYDNGIATLGYADAPVTVIEYASMTCGHCAKFHTESLPTIKARYVETGLVKVEFRPFPLDIWAARASMIASCSGEKYFAYTDLLFRRQSQWISNDQDKIEEELKKLAAIGGMGQDAVEACLANEALFNRIVEIRQQGQTEHSVNSTPSLVINGKTYSGEMSPAEFSKHVDPLLDKHLN